MRNVFIVLELISKFTVEPNSLTDEERNFLISELIAKVRQLQKDRD